MFYQMITNARNRWLGSDQCTVKDLITYIESASQMRDAQIDAIKTYLFLKIACDCKPLSQLFQDGCFKAFCEKRTYKTRSECIPEEASLLNIANFSPMVHTQNTADYFPTQDVVERIIQDDKGKLKPDKNTLQMMQLAEQAGQTKILEMLRSQVVSHPQKDRSFHYLPYRTDSCFEQTFLREVLPLPEMERFGLEVYYNGDRAMTEFKIKCYKAAGQGWSYIGMYTPDFLIIQRKDGKIHKALIVETKGKIYATDPTFKDKRAFVESEFLRQNNASFGYERFEYLYLEDTMSERERIVKTHKKICEFFEEHF